MASSSNRRIYYSFFAALLLVCVAGGVYYYMVSTDGQQQAAMQPAAGGEEGQAQQQQPMPVNVVVLQPRDVTIWKEFSGRLEAVAYAEIRPQVSGVIQEVRFEDGQDVQEDDVLYVIDQRPYQATVDLAEAELSAAKARLNLAGKELKRAQDLIKTKAISERIVDARENERNLAAAQIKSAEASLAQAQINLDYTLVKAPFSGRVGRVEVKPGNVVEAGPSAPLLTTIVAIDKIYADFEVDERTYLTYVRSGARDRAAEIQIPVQMRLTQQSDLYDGVIYSFDNQLDASSGTIRARALFMNSDGALLPGMFVQVKLGSSNGGKKILIPERAVGTDQSRRYVYVVGDDNVVQYREVSLGDSVNGERVVLEGLSAGEKVIVDGVIRIRPGMPVNPQPVGAADNADSSAAPASEGE